MIRLLMIMVPILVTGTKGLSAEKGSKISFKKDGNIYIMDADGKNEKKLTDFAKGEKLQLGHYAWSADGNKLGYEARASDEYFGLIYVIDCDGKNKYILTKKGRLIFPYKEPFSSPDGKKFIYNGPDGITIIDHDGKNERVIFKAQMSSLRKNVCWSADSKRLAFACPGKDGLDMLVLDIDGGKKELKLKSAGASVDDLTWLPDGINLVFVCYPKSDEPESTADQRSVDIMIVNTNSGDEKTLVKTHRPYLDTVSPDGKKVVVTGWKEYTGDDRSKKNGVFTISVMDTDGKNLKTFIEIDNLSLMGPSWSPDGEKLAVIGHRKEGNKSYPYLHVINVDGSGNKKLDGINAGGYAEPYWSPDGKMIAWVLFGGPKIYIFKADGSGKTEIAQGLEVAWQPAK